MKLPLKMSDGSVVTYETFASDADHMVAIDDRTYRVRRAGDQTYYFMLRVGGHQRSLRGPFDAVVNAIAHVHAVYTEYEQRVRRLKEDAQRARDRRLNEVAESLS